MPVARSGDRFAEPFAGVERRAARGAGRRRAISPSPGACIRAEIAGLEQLWRDALDGAFGRALDLCAAARGRLIVTGIGKSGHVARKIAATLASTGTPAQFVHAAEASHGDLGMIGAEDAILALSNSGESAELADIIAYSRRFEIPLIAITGGRESTLAEAADVVLLLPARRRGVPDGAGADDLDDDDDGARRRAGDRAARAQGVFVGRFPAASIPAAGSAAGCCGSRDIMHSGDAVPLVSPQTPMSEAILRDDREELRLRRRVRRRRAAGRGHHRRRSAPPYGRRAAGAHGRGDHAPEPEDDHRRRHLAAEALGLMNRFAITALFVVDEEARPTGFLHMHDCLRAGIA